MPALSSGLRSISEYVRDRQAMSREQFLLAHPTPVLVIPVPDAAADSEAFTTRPLPLQGGPPAAWVAAKVKKRSGDAFPNFVWVGRESKCDIALPFEGVSKLHAQFVLQPDGEVDLLDTRSANGTFADGERLLDNVPRRMRDGTRIRMGPLEMTYRTAAGFWEELATWSRGAAS